MAFRKASNWASKSKNRYHVTLDGMTKEEDTFAESPRGEVFLLFPEVQRLGAISFSIHFVLDRFCLVACLITRQSGVLVPRPQTIYGFGSVTVKHDRMTKNTTSRSGGATFQVVRLKLNI